MKGRAGRLEDGGSSEPATRRAPLRPLLCGEHIRAAFAWLCREPDAKFGVELGALLLTARPRRLGLRPPTTRPGAGVTIPRLERKLLKVQLRAVVSSLSLPCARPRSPF